MDKLSFTAASVFPAKLLKTKVVDENNRIMPVHLQLNPTNVCNFNCPFCSCANRDTTMQLSYEKHKTILENAAEAGCRSVTITGGGEPLMHPQINKIISLCHSLGIKVGIVTNGSLIRRLEKSLDKIVWCRISASDYLEYNMNRLSKTVDDWFSSISDAVKKGKNVDWAFSYVLGAHPDYEMLSGIIKFASERSFTHVRVVSDLLDIENVPSMDAVKREIRKRNIDDSIVIYQGRKKYVKGAKRCLISLLKPVVGPDGKLYPCCGSQYALEVPSEDYPEEMCMGDASDIKEIFEKQKHFDGSVCVRCYYQQYNQALEIMTKKLKHEEFV